MDILSIILTVIIVVISVLIVMVVLLQRPKQEGLGAAFGGSTLDGALGAQTTDVLQKATTIFAVIFFVCSVGLAMIKTRQFDTTGSKNVLEEVGKQEAGLPSLPDGISPATILPSDPVGGEDPLLPSGGILPSDPAPAPAPAPAEDASGDSSGESKSSEGSKGEVPSPAPAPAGDPAPEPAGEKDPN